MEKKIILGYYDTVMKINNKSALVILTLVMALITKSASQEDRNTPCNEPGKTHLMHVNTTQVKLKNNGQLFETGQYIKNSGSIPISLLNNAAVWAGGVDRAGNLKTCGVSYPGNGFDFVSGPLDKNGTTEETTCSKWDEIFSVKGSSIQLLIDLFSQAEMSGVTLDCAEVPEDLLYWPARGNPYFFERYGWFLPDQPLAGFWDRDDDGIYNPCKGDYPWVEDHNCISYHSHEVEIPAEINFYIFNDVGRGHSFTSPNIAQLEFQVHVFAYASNDELNNMTFFQYKIINKAHEDLVDFYFGLWVDPDLGCGADDFAGCDSAQGLAYVYNSDSTDGADHILCTGIPSNGQEVPVVGFDFIRGPMVSQVYVRDENGMIIRGQYGAPLLQDPAPVTGTQDTLVVGRMSSFMVFADCPKSIDFFGSPQCLSARFYNQLRGFWEDNSPVYYAGDGYHQDSTATTRYMYPDDPDKGGGWSMCTASDDHNSDVMLLMSVGPMLFQPWQENTLRLAVMTVDGIKSPCPDITKLKYSDLYVKERFDNCFEFEPFSTPGHPEITGLELDQKLFLSLHNNAEIEDYKEKIRAVPDPFDNYFRFEGYKIFQLRHDSVRGNQLDDNDLARLVAQTDIKNGISDIYNWYYLPNPDTISDQKFIWEKRLMVTGADSGLETSFIVKKDLFAEPGNDALINGKKYHYYAVSYAHNQWRPFDTLEKYGQKTPYLQSPFILKTFTFIPGENVKDEPVNLQLTRISGEGNPGVFLELDEDMHEHILSSEFDGKVSYLPGYGPLKIKVLDPGKIDISHMFRVEVEGSYNSANCQYDADAHWKLTNISTGNVMLENAPLSVSREYSFWDQGFSIFLANGNEPGNQLSDSNGGIGAKATYKETNGISWYDAVKEDGLVKNVRYGEADFTVSKDKDPQKNLCRLGDGYFVPFNALASGNITTDTLKFSLAMDGLASYQFSSFNDLNNVDVVFTSDTSEWSRCIVIETTNPQLKESGFQTIGNADFWGLRRTPSINKDGKQTSDGSFGLSYFPGYAIDVETGKRLNVFFGESSIHDNGKDLVFNPSDVTIDSSMIKTGDLRGLVFGGHHYIYVTKTQYDGCESMAKQLGAYTTPNNYFLPKYKISKVIKWVSWPICHGLLPLGKRLIPNELSIRLRVENSYNKSQAFTAESFINCMTVNDHPVYEFGFEKIENVADKAIKMQSIYPNPVISASETIILTLTNIEEPGYITVYKPDSNVLTKIDTGMMTSYGSIHGNDNLVFELTDLNLSPGLHFIKYTSKTTGKSKTFKWLVL